MATYRVTIVEHQKCVVDVEAESFEQAKELVEKDYWENPLGYCLEPYDTFFE